MKTKKNILYILLIMIISATLHVSASSKLGDAGAGDYSCEGIPPEKAEQITKDILKTQDDSAVQPNSVLCNTAGHDISHGKVVMKEHKIYSDNPRCARTTAFVDFCTRCCYFKITSRTGGRIVCC